MPYANHRGIRIYYEVEGRGPPLLLAHGFADSLETWRDYGFAQRLAEDYRLILVDLRGHGRSDKPHDEAAYVSDLLAGDLAAALDDLEIDRAHFLGTSSGAQLAFAFPSSGVLPRFRSFVLGGANPYWFAGHASPAIVEAGKDLTAAVSESSAAMLAFFEERGLEPVSPAERTRLLANDHLALTAYLAAMSANESAPFAVEPLLARLTLPCLLYAGEADFNFEGAKRAAVIMPNASFVALPGLDHFQTGTRADLVVPVAKRFLAAVD